MSCIEITYFTYWTEDNPMLQSAAVTSSMTITQQSLCYLVSLNFDLMKAKIFREKMRSNKELVL